MSSLADYQITNIDEIPSPSLVVFRKYVEHNIKTVGEIVGGYEGLRPHIKTHKMSQIARMEMAAGITKFKCATPKEAAMLASIGAKDIVIAYHIVGPQIQRIIELRHSHPDVTFKIIADDPGAIAVLSEACQAADITVGVLIDLNTGLNRTGTEPGEPSLQLARVIHDAPGLTFEGLHVYDGHVGGGTDEERQIEAKASIDLGTNTRSLIEEAGIPVNEFVASGSRGFDVTARQEGVDNVSPGTWTLWDTGYGDMLDFPFKWAALVISRVISRPDDDLVTLDAGHKSIAPDTPAPHFRVLGLDGEPEFLIRNEEHQLLRWPKGQEPPRVGTVLYLVPTHVCTTVNMWDEAFVIDDEGKWSETWPIDARGH